MTVALLEKEQIAAFWPSIIAKRDSRPDVQSGMSPEELFRDAMNGYMQVWALVRADLWIDVVFFTQVLQQPRGRVMLVTEAWGEDIEEHFEEMAAMIPMIAERMALDAIEFEGRPGWLRPLQRMGFKLARVVMSAPLGRTVN